MVAMSSNLLHSELGRCDRSDGLLSPQVFHNVPASGNADVSHVELKWAVVKLFPVDDDGCDVAIRKGSRVHLGLPQQLVQEAAVNRAFALLSHGVLVDGDEVIVLENVQTVFADVSDIIAHDQRTLGKTPQREVSLLLGDSHASVAHLQHVGIIPMTRP